MFELIYYPLVLYISMYIILWLVGWLVANEYWKYGGYGTMDELIYVIMSAVLGGAAGAFLYNVLHNFGLNRRISALENRVYREEQKERGAKGNAAQAAAKEREGLAIAEAAAMLQTGAELQDVLKTIGAKYPDVAVGLLKRFGV